MPHPKSLSKREGLEELRAANSLSFGEGWGEAKHQIYMPKRSMGKINLELAEAFDTNLIKF